MFCDVGDFVVECLIFSLYFGDQGLIVVFVEVICNDLFDCCVVDVWWMWVFFGDFDEDLIVFGDVVLEFWDLVILLDEFDFWL